MLRYQATSLLKLDDVAVNTDISGDDIITGELSREKGATTLLQLGGQKLGTTADGSQPHRKDVATPLLLLGDFTNSAQPDEHVHSIGTQTEITSQLLTGLDECETLRKEKYELCKIVQISFKSDDMKLKFYTGLDSFETFESVFNLLAPF